MEKYWQAKAEAHRTDLDACYCSAEWFCAGYMAEMWLAPKKNQGEL